MLIRTMEKRTVYYSTSHIKVIAPPPPFKSQMFLKSIIL